VEILVGECSLYSNYLVQSSFLFGVGTAFHTPPWGTPFPHPLFSSTSLGFLQLHVHSVIPCLRPIPTEPSPEGLK